MGNEGSDPTFPTFPRWADGREAGLTIRRDHGSKWIGRHPDAFWVLALTICRDCGLVRPIDRHLRAGAQQNLYDGWSEQALVQDLMAACGARGYPARK